MQFLRKLTAARNLLGDNRINMDHPVTKEEDDPKYRIAYDVDRDKVGCVSIQAALGGDVPRDLFLRYFSTGYAWTVNASACKIYLIHHYSQSEPCPA